MNTTTETFMLAELSKHYSPSDPRHELDCDYWSMIAIISSYFCDMASFARTDTGVGSALVSLAARLETRRPNDTSVNNAVGRRGDL